LGTPPTVPVVVVMLNAAWASKLAPATSANSAQAFANAFH
jgi:hypothetical protein